MLRSGGQWESRAQPPTDYKSGWNSVPSREIIRQAEGTWGKGGESFPLLTANPGAHF